MLEDQRAPENSKMPSHAIRLAPKNSHHILERRPRYDVLLNGTRVGEHYYNMTDYVGGLPMVQGHSMNIVREPSAPGSKRSRCSTVMRPP